ncbi:hypothetical protein B0H13DRAFT_1467875, partial [Mycena leptocephala]
IYSFRFGNQLVVVLSDPGVVKDLMVTNGTTFSSRMDMFMEAQTIFLRRPITGTGYYDTWRKHRRITYSYLQQRSVSTFLPGLDYEASILVKTLFEDSKRGLQPINPQ